MRLPTTVHSLKERHYSDHYFVTQSSGRSWLGGTDAAVEDEWVWPDGTPVLDKTVVNCV